MSKGILVVISGFSGAGQGTLMKQLMATYGEEYGLNIESTYKVGTSIAVRIPVVKKQTF